MSNLIEVQQITFLDREKKTTYTLDHTDIIILNKNQEEIEENKEENESMLYLYQNEGRNFTNSVKLTDDRKVETLKNEDKIIVNTKIGEPNNTSFRYITGATLKAQLGTGGGGGGGGGGGSSNGVFTVDEINIPDNSDTQATFTKGIVYFNITDTEQLYKRVINSGSSGQVVHIMFDTDGSSLELDFGSDKLGIGSGMAQFLTFSQSGQSASIVFVGNKWRVLNTGAMVSNTEQEVS